MNLRDGIPGKGKVHQPLRPWDGRLENGRDPLKEDSWLRKIGIIRVVVDAAAGWRCRRRVRGLKLKGKHGVVAS